MRVLVAQMGARMHYAVPRIFYDAGSLRVFHTDICAVKGWPSILRKVLPKSIRPAVLQRLLGRIPYEIPTGKIRAHTSFGLKYAMRRIRARTLSELTGVHLWAGSEFCRLVSKENFSGTNAVYTFNSAGLELLKKAGDLGIKRVVEQTMAPRQTLENILALEYLKYPEYYSANSSDDLWAEFAERERAEWENADLIICGSQFVVDSIGELEGPTRRTTVVPYGIDISFCGNGRAEKAAHRGLHVLFVGEVGLRKGAHYLIKAAQMLKRRNIIFRMVGMMALPDSLRKNLPENIEIIGGVPRNMIMEQYEWADVFCLPSLCEGSATVTYEALFMGLPIICTPNTGSVIRDGVEGFIVPACDHVALAEKLDLLSSSSELLRFMSDSAIRLKHQYTLKAYGDRLREAIERT